MVFKVVEQTERASGHCSPSGSNAGKKVTAQERGRIAMAKQQREESPASRTHRDRESGSIDFLIKSMTSNPHDGGVQVASGRALCNLALGSPSNRIRIADAGGITAILTAMQTFRVNSAIQRFSCRAMALLLTGGGKNESNKTVIKRLMVQELATAQILVAMEMHRKDPEVQRYGRMALRRMGFQDKSKSAAQSSSEFVLDVLHSAVTSAVGVVASSGGAAPSPCGKDDDAATIPIVSMSSTSSIVSTDEASVPERRASSKSGASWMREQKTEATQVLCNEIRDLQYKLQEAEELIQNAKVFLRIRLAAGNEIGTDLSVKRICKYQVDKELLLRARMELERLKKQVRASKQPIDYKARIKSALDTLAGHANALTDDNAIIDDDGERFREQVLQEAMESIKDGMETDTPEASTEEFEPCSPIARKCARVCKETEEKNSQMRRRSLSDFVNPPAVVETDDDSSTLFSGASRNSDGRSCPVAEDEDDDTFESRISSYLSQFAAPTPTAAAADGAPSSSTLLYR